MEKWPNLFIVGASKSATGTLYVHLTKVPSICMSTIKEPNYFSVKVHPGDGELVIRDKKQYQSLFNIGKDDKIIGVSQVFWTGLSDNLVVFTNIKETQVLFFITNN